MTRHDNAYTSLVEADDDARWAFGTSFDDPLAGMDTSVPAGVDAAELAGFCLMLGDDALVLAQRLGEWTTRAPEIEEEVALANIGLDLLGQARLLLARAAAADPGVVPVLPAGSPVPADDRLAFFRDAGDFRHVHLVEQPNGDFAATMARLLVFSAWRHALLARLQLVAGPGARRARREGRERSSLPPRARGPLVHQAGPRNGRIPRPHGRRPRGGVARRRRAGRHRARGCLR